MAGQKTTFGNYNKPPVTTGGTLQYDQSTNTWYNPTTGQKVKSPENQPWTPNMQDLYQKSQSGLDKYYGSLPGQADQLTGLGQKIEDVGTYKGYNWNIPTDYELPDYQKHSGYDNLSMERTDFTTPQIDALKDVSPVAAGIYGGQIAKSNEAVGNRYKNLKSQVEEEARRNMARPEQAAALLSSLGVEESKAKGEGARDIQFEQAQQQLDLEKKAQELGLQRSTSQAGLTQQGQQMSAAERQAAAEYAKSVEDLKAGEGRYGYESDVAKKQYGTGMKTWLQEQQAAEAEKEFQSKYGQAQDLTSLQAQEWEANQASKYDLANALLQGQQAQTGLTSQAGTYITNLPEDMQEEALKSTPVQPSYQPQNYAQKTGQSPQNLQSSFKKSATAQQASSYAMPGQAKKATPSYSMPWQKTVATTQKYSMPQKAKTTNQQPTKQAFGRY